MGAAGHRQRPPAGGGRNQLVNTAQGWRSTCCRPHLPSSTADDLGHARRARLGGPPHRRGHLQPYGGVCLTMGSRLKLAAPDPEPAPAQPPQKLLAGYLAPGRPLVTGTPTGGGASHRWSPVNTHPSGSSPAAIMFYGSLQTARHLKHPRETVRGRERRLQARGIARLPDVHLSRPGGLAVPDRQGQGGHPVPHRPLPPRAPTRQGPQRADPARTETRVRVDRAARPVSAGAELVGHVRLGYARASTARQSHDAQLDSLAEAGVTTSSPRRSPPAPPSAPSWRPP
jgi:hypothetical protein